MAPEDGDGDVVVVVPVGLSRMLLTVTAVTFMPAGQFSPLGSCYSLPGAKVACLQPLYLVRQVCPEHIFH